MPSVGLIVFLLQGARFVHAAKNEIGAVSEAPSGVRH
jgi:hypothetical protein